MWSGTAPTGKHFSPGKVQSELPQHAEAGAVKLPSALRDEEEEGEQESRARCWFRQHPTQVHT